LTAQRIADLVEVSAADTVVRLDGTRGRLDELVLTGDVTRSLFAVLEAAQGPAGAGFLLVGHFGSGKSHFLAAVAELLAAPGRARELRGWDGPARDLALTARPSLAVTVPLVEYRADAELEDVVWRRAWQALGREPGDRDSDRTAAWRGLLDAARAAGHAGLLLVVDELSEFLRAKRGPGLTEDLRFLQFAGEWARHAPVIVVGALQESLDEVASVSERELARIRDRYPVRLGLSMRHVEDLVRGRLVPLRPGAGEEVERVYRRLRSALPGWSVSPEAFHACYPLHPETLTLLDGLRFLFSQQRGVVDFICRQLRGDPAAGIPAWQERPADDLLCPDRVYDHFESRLRERVETARLAETVVPYYERAVGTLIGDASDRELALRAVKLLTLLAASPLERRRDARELAGMLLCRVSSIDPDANATYLAEAVLEPIAGHGAYIVARPRGHLPTYEVELESDAGLTVARLVEQERARLPPDDRRIVDTLLDLGGTPALSVGLIREAGRSRRQVIWQNTLRHVLVVVARLSELGPPELEELAETVERTRSEACMVIVEPEPGDRDEPLLARARELAVSSRLALWVPAPLDAGERDFAADLFCRQTVLRQATEEGRGGLLDFLRRSVESDVARAREVVRRCYFQGRVVAADLDPSLDLPALSGLNFDGVLRGIAGPLLQGLHPRHREVQPLTELVSDRHVRRLIGFALAGPRVTVAAAEREGVRAAVEAFLVPLGVLRKRGDAFVLAPDPARSPAVAELLRLVAGGPRDRGDVVGALARGPVGLSEPESLLLLNAAVQSGIAEATRGRRRVEAPFLSLEEVERLGPGELLASELRARLAELPQLFGPGPFEPWDARVQQASWESARAWLEARRDDVAACRDGLRRLADSPLHADAQLGGLPDDLDRLERLLAGTDLAAPPREGLETLLGVVGEPAELVAAVGRVAAAARFCRTGLGALAAASAYLLDPALVVPDMTRYEGLRVTREDALRLAARALPLAAEDRASEAAEAADQFRRAFAAAYQTEHERFYSGTGPRAALAVTSSPEYRALALLGEISASAVPDDRVKVDRALAAGSVVPCTRRVEAELALRPICGCGFTLGSEPPRVDTAGLVATATRGVAQQLTELDRPDARARLERAAEDLASLGQAEVAADLSRLLELAAAPERADAVAVAHLVAGSAGAVLRQVLRGGQVVVRRDLAALRAELAGRRYPKRRLLELVRAWVEGPEAMQEQAVVEVVDSEEAAAPVSAGPPGSDGGATVRFLRDRFPQVAALLPPQRAADALWLAAWWRGRGAPPAWLPLPLVDEPGLGEAAAAAAREPGPRAELAELDDRLGARTLAGGQVVAALDLGGRGDAEVVAALLDERLLRAPVILAGGELARRLAGTPRLAERVPAGALERLAAEHPGLDAATLAPLRAVLAASARLAALERRLPGAGPAELVADVYPAQHAPVAALLCEAGAGWAGAGFAAEALDAFVASARRRLDEAETAFQAGARADWPGCLRIWEVGETVVAPLLREHGRVAVLLVDAMRADLWLRFRPRLREALPGRTLVERWAVVPDPTRTVEAVASLYLGRRVAGGELAGPGDLPRPFAHLGGESSALVGADADGRGDAARERWRSGPALTVVVATAVDELLHRTPVELTALLEESGASLERRVLPTLEALPANVPLVVLADHGFRENRWWGRTSETRYAHGGLSLEESVVPVAVLVSSR
jgi:Family of unknown function (DUF6079)